MSQESSASTVPFELSQNQDDDFIDELNNVNELYFQVSQGQTNAPFDENFSGSESDVDSCNDDSDCDNVDICNTCTFEVEHSDTDIHEHEKQNKFRNETCGCQEFYFGKPCSTVISFDDVIEFRQYCLELSRDELDLVVKAELYSHRSSGSTTDSKKHQSKDRVRPSQQFFFRGNRVCRKTFCFLHCIDKQKLQVIGRSLDSDGLKPRVHGLSGKQPYNSMTFDERKYIHTFLNNYASDHALPLPGRLPNHRKANVLLLPSDKRQADIHVVYQKAAKSAGIRVISFSSFARIWRELCPNIVLSKPSTDLCHTCQNWLMT